MVEIQNMTPTRRLQPAYVADATGVQRIHSLRLIEDECPDLNPDTFVLDAAVAV